MRLLRDNILVRPLAKAQIGKIIMPDVVEDDWRRGEVLAVGPGLWDSGKRVPLDVEVGDIIIFMPMPGGGKFPSVTVDGEDLIIFNDRFVHGIEDGAMKETEDEN